MSHPPSSSSRPLGAWLPEVAVLAVALLARVWRLGYHSVWFDEAVSLRWARSDPAWIWSKTFPLIEDKHPPAYYLLLHLWHKTLALFGLERNDVALRLSGSMLGVLAVVGLYLLARRLSGRRVALLAALFAALSPLLVWYSQELRMFQPAACALIWGGWFMLRAWDGWTRARRAGWWLAMIAAFAFALYAYLFSALALPAAGLSLLALWVAARDKRDRTGRLIEGILAFALLALLFLPLARNAWLVNGSEGLPGHPFQDVVPTALRLLRVFTVWRPGWPSALETLAIGLLGALALVGVAFPRQDRARIDRIWLALWIVLPWLIGNLLLATTDTVFAEDRYFLFVAPFLLWAAACGVITLGERSRPLAWASGGAAALALFCALPVLWTPATARENWRAAVDLIGEQASQNPALRSALISHVDYTRLPAEWYLRQRFTFDELPLFYPYGGALREEDMETVVAPPLEGLAQEEYATLWLLQSHLDGVDDNRLVERWLSERYPLVTEAYPAGIKVSGYAQQSLFDGLPPLAASAVTPARELVPGLVLAACEVVTPEVAAADDALHPPSGWVHVRLWWHPTATVSGDYRARVRVADSAGVWGESLDRDGDALRRLPTSTWSQGGYVRHELDVNMNPVTPAGEYDILVRLLDAQGADAGPEIPCGKVRIVQATGK